MNIIKGQDTAKDLLETACKRDLAALLVGETGTGKTSLVREVAHKHGRTYTRFSITGETTVDDFVGKYILKNGETKWQDGILLTAIKKGHYLVVDEINAALPEILFVLHSLLDDDKYVIVPQKDNATVKPHKDFRFFATMNPVDEYAGTKELNKAFMSRFAMVLDIKYPSRATETDVLVQRTGVKLEEAMKMVDVAIGVRRAKQDDKIFYTFSTRDLIFWGDLVEDLGIHPAFRVAIRNKSLEDGEAIEKIYQKVFSDYQRETTKNKEFTNFEYWVNKEKSIATAEKNYKRTATARAKRALTKENDELDKKKREVKLLLNDFQSKTGLDKAMVDKLMAARGNTIDITSNEAPF